MARSTSKRVIYAALGGNLLVAMTKFVAAGLTGSAAMFSEAIHSTVDSGNQLLLLLGMRVPRGQRIPGIPSATASSSIFGPSLSPC